MAYFVITYDVRARPGHSYEPLYEWLNNSEAAHLQNSVWLLDIALTAIQVREAMKPHMHNDDTWCVLEIFHNSMWGTWRARETGVDWLKARMAQQ